MTSAFGASSSTTGGEKEDAGEEERSLRLRLEDEDGRL